MKSLLYFCGSTNTVFSIFAIYSIKENKMYTCCLFYSYDYLLFTNKNKNKIEIENKQKIIFIIIYKNPFLYINYVKTKKKNGKNFQRNACVNIKSF